MLQLVSAHVLPIELAAEWYHYIRYIYRSWPGPLEDIIFLWLWLSKS